MSNNVKKSGGWRTNKWIRAAIPALLLHCSIGTVYCWSIFSQEIADHIGFSKGATEWAFSFAIFFLGMSAAFLGNVVEKDIHKSSLIAAICFAVGMAGTGAFIYYGGLHKGSPLALIGIYLCYGLIMGIGLGTGYLSPVKTLMLWFKDKKGLATGLAVAGFGAAKAIASPIMQSMLSGLGEGGIYKMFIILAVVYFVMMFIGHLLLKKPDDWHEPQSGEEKQSIMAVLKTRPITNYIGIWLMFYINITCGLALISQEKAIVKCIGLAGVVGIVSTVSAIFNAGGRLGLSAMGDKMKDRNTVYKIIFIASIVITAVVIVTGGIKNGANNPVLAFLVLALIMIVNAGYGGGFSNVPTLLSDHYGMGSISAIHGITLSAWAFAGLTGNQLATWIVNHVGDTTAAYNPVGYQTVLYVTVALYVVALLLSFIFVRPNASADNKETTEIPAPVGQRKTNKGLLKTLLLSIITFGIYPLVVMSSVSNDINIVASRYDGRKTMHFCLLSFIIAPITFGIAGIVWYHNISNRIGTELKRRGIAYNFSAADYWLWCVLGSLIFVGPFIYLHKLFKATNLMNAHYNING